MCRWAFLTAVASALACVGGADASPSLPPLPARWPQALHHVRVPLAPAHSVALASSFAQQFVRLRNELAPNVLLAYHMSGWGTKHDIVYEDPPDATVRKYAAQSAAFYRALHAKLDVAFED